MRRLAFVALLAISCSASYIQPRNLPPIPDSVPTQLGPLPIRRVAHAVCDGEPVYGCFRPDSFDIILRDSIKPEVAWQTLRHEVGHAALFIAGVQIKSEAEEDLIMDAMASQGVLEMRAGWPR